MRSRLLKRVCLAGVLGLLGLGLATPVLTAPPDEVESTKTKELFISTTINGKRTLIFGPARLHVTVKSRRLEAPNPPITQIAIGELDISGTKATVNGSSSSDTKTYEYQTPPSIKQVAPLEPGQRTFSGRGQATYQLKDVKAGDDVDQVLRAVFEFTATLNPTSLEVEDFVVDFAG